MEEREDIVKNAGNIPVPFAPLALDFFNNPKFREASYLAKKDGKDFLPGWFLLTFQFYFTKSKKERSNQDVRIIPLFELISLMGWDEVLIQDINTYLIRVKLLDKKYMIPSYYLYNPSDRKKLSTVESVEKKLSTVESVEKKLSTVESAVEYLIDKKIDKKLYDAWYFQRVTKGLSCKASYDILISRGYTIQTRIFETQPEHAVESVEKKLSTVESVEYPLDYKSLENSKSYSVGGMSKVIDNINEKLTIEEATIENKTFEKKQTIKLLSFNDQSKEETREWFGERTYWIFLSSTLNAIKDTVGDQTTIDGIETLKNDIGYSKEAYSEIYDVIIKEGISKVSCSPLELIKNGFLGVYFYIRQCEAIKRKGVWIKAAQYFTKKTNNNLNNLYEALEYTGIQKILALCKDEGLLRITEEGGLYHDRNKIEFQQKKRRR